MKEYKFILYNSTLGQQEVPTPDGWQDTRFTKAKNDRYWALEYTITGNYSFVDEGYDFLVSAFELEGIETRVFCQVQYYLKSEKRYKAIFTGLVDFTEKEVSRDRYTVTIEKLDVARKLLNRDEEILNLQELTDLDDNAISSYDTEFVTIPMHSKTIQRVYEGNTEGYIHDANPSISGGTNNNVFFQLLEFNKVQDDLDVVGFNITNLQWDNNIATNITFDPEDDKLYIFEVQEEGNYTIDVNLDYEWIFGYNSARSDVADYTLYLVFINSDESRAVTSLGGIDFMDANVPYGSFDYIEIPSRVNETNSGGIYGTGPLNINTSFSRNLKIGTEVYIYGRFMFRDVAINQYFKLNDTSTIKITGNTTFEETECRGMLAHEYFDRLITKITGNEKSFYSELLGRIDSEPYQYSIDGEGSLLFFTNGYQIRELPIDDRPLFVSFYDAFQTVNAIYNVGLGIEYVNGKQLIRLEKKEYFYGKSRLILGEEPTYNISVAKDFIASSFEIGYKKWKNEQKNNLDEFNTKHLYVLPLTKIKKKESHVAPHVAAGYSIEESRRMKYKITEDNDNDDENFVIKVIRIAEGYRPQTTDGFSSVTNVIDSNSVYNLDISPKRNFYRWGKYINISTYLQDSKIIKFSYGEGNYKMTSTKSGVTVSEGSDVVVSDLPNRFFKPERYKIEKMKVSEEDIIKIYNATSIVIEFENYSGGITFGIVESIDVKPHDRTIEADVLEIASDIAREIVITDKEAEAQGGGGLDSELDFEMA